MGKRFPGQYAELHCHTGRPTQLSQQLGCRMAHRSQNRPWPSPTGVVSASANRNSGEHCMKRRAPYLAGALVALTVSLVVPTSALAAMPADGSSQFLSLLNADRTAAGLPPLAVDSTLSSIAAQRAQQELAAGTLSHYDSAGNLVFQSLLTNSG